VFKWIEFALIPLAGMRVPCSEQEILVRWVDTKTAATIERDAKEKGYLAPSEMPAVIQSGATSLFGGQPCLWHRDALALRVIRNGVAAGPKKCPEINRQNSPHVLIRKYLISDAPHATFAP
jgi:hypothetical protein